MSALIERSLSLYEHLDLMDLAAQTEDESTPEAGVALEETIRKQIAESTSEKVENIHRVLVSVEMMDAAIDAEIKRLRERKEANERIRLRIRNSVQYAMEAHEIKKISGRTVTFSLRSKPASVVFDDESLIPAKFKTIVLKLPLALWQSLIKAMDESTAAELIEALKAKEPETVISKTAVKKAIDAGEDVPGADVSFGGQSLMVK